MKTLIAFVMTVTSFSLASAGDLGDVIRILVEGAAVDMAGRALDRALQPRTSPLVLAQAGNLGRLIVRPSRDGWGGCDSREAVALAQLVLDQAGWEILSPEGREEFRREMRQTRDHAYDSSQALPEGSLVGTDKIVFVSVRLRRGAERQLDIYRRRAGGGQTIREVCADATMSFVDASGATHMVRAAGSSFDQLREFNLGGWNSRAGYSSRVPADEERAILTALVRAANEETRRLTPAWRYDPMSGKPIARQQAGCPACSAPTPVGANFCPLCGQKLK